MQFAAVFVDQNIRIIDFVRTRKAGRQDVPLRHFRRHQPMLAYRSGDDSSELLQGSIHWRCILRTDLVHQLGIHQPDLCSCTFVTPAVGGATSSDTLRCLCTVSPCTGPPAAAAEIGSCGGNPEVGVGTAAKPH